MLVLVAVPGAALLIGILATWRLASGEGWRWGWRVAGQVDVGDGAYRSAPVDVREPRRLPLVCGVAAATGVAWGILNLFVFAPSGLLMSLGVVVDAGGNLPLGLFGAMALLAASVHGFRIGVMLIGLLRPLVVRTEWSATKVKHARFVSTWHHALVTLSFVLLAAGEGLRVMLGFLIPCAVGFAHVALLWRAQLVLYRLDEEDRRAIA